MLCCVVELLQRLVGEATGRAELGWAGDDQLEFINFTEHDQTQCKLQCGGDSSAWVIPPELCTVVAADEGGVEEGMGNGDGDGDAAPRESKTFACLLEVMYSTVLVCLCSWSNK